MQHLKKKNPQTNVVPELLSKIDIAETFLLIFSEFDTIIIYTYINM